MTHTHLQEREFPLNQCLCLQVRMRHKPKHAEPKRLCALTAVELSKATGARRGFDPVDLQRPSVTLSLETDRRRNPQWSPQNFLLCNSTAALLREQRPGHIARKDKRTWQVRWRWKHKKLIQEKRRERERWGALESEKDKSSWEGHANERRGHGEGRGAKVRQRNIWTRVSQMVETWDTEKPDWSAHVCVFQQ